VKLINLSGPTELVPYVVKPNHFAITGDGAGESRVVFAPEIYAAMKTEGSRQ